MSLIVDAHVDIIFYASIISVGGPYPSSTSMLLGSSANCGIVSKTFFLLLGRFVYFSLFHPLASFPGPVLARVGDVRTRNPD
jgi:hypothetical protein